MTRIVLAITAMFLTACGPQIDRYVIREGTPYQWIVVDTARRDCPPSTETLWQRETTIDGSGYVCTSSPLLESAWQRFFLRTAEDRERVLAVGKMIQRPSRLHISRSAGWTCDADAIVFFYGPKIPTGSTPDAVLQRARPECKPLLTHTSARPSQHHD
jgi:hypothetical protein